MSTNHKILWSTIRFHSSLHQLCPFVSVCCHWLRASAHGRCFRTISHNRRCPYVPVTMLIMQVEREFRLQVPPRVYNFKDRGRQRFRCAELYKTWPWDEEQLSNWNYWSLTCEDISCKNTACVSHPKNMQHEVEPFFERCRHAGVCIWPGQRSIKTQGLRKLLNWNRGKAAIWGEFDWLYTPAHQTKTWKICKLQRYWISRAQLEGLDGHLEEFHSLRFRAAALQGQVVKSRRMWWLSTASSGLIALCIAGTGIWRHAAWGCGHVCWHRKCDDVETP